MKNPPAPPPDPADDPGGSMTGQVEAVLRQLWPAMRAYAVALTGGNGHAMEEVLQESALHIWEKREELKIVRNLKAWALRIVYFKALSYHRDKAGSLVFFSEQSLELIAGAGAARLNGTESRLDLLVRCLEKLRKEERLLVTWHYADNKSFRELSRQLRRTETSVYQQVYRIRRALRRCVESKAREGVQ